MVIFRLFKMAAAAILDFQNLRFLTFGAVMRVELHNRAKFTRNRSNRARDMVIFRFLKMAAAAGGRRHLVFSKFRIFNGPARHKLIIIIIIIIIKSLMMQSLLEQTFCYYSARSFRMWRTNWLHSFCRILIVYNSDTQLQTLITIRQVVYAAPVTRNVWQSLACSPRGIAVTSPSE